MSKVIVVLPGDEARGLSWIPRVRAALDRDPDALIEQVAKALLGNNPGWGEWETVSDDDRRIFESDARAAIAAITGEECPK